jgi:FkbM family methyltransferase
MAAWCRQVEKPLILDIGGHVGFIATQIAQLLEDKRPKIYSFEPIPYSFKRLFESVRLLGLEDLVIPICAALSDKPGMVHLSYCEWDSMFAQLFETEPNRRVGDKVAWSNALTLDQVVEFIGRPPDLIKIDVEGHEVQIFKGGRNVLSNQEPPALCFELNPLTLSEAGSNAAELGEQICHYEFYYISDFEHQRAEFGAQIGDLKTIDWVCNIFAAPKTETARHRSRVAIEETKRILAPATRRRHGWGFMTQRLTQ